MGIRDWIQGTSASRDADTSVQTRAPATRWITYDKYGHVAARRMEHILAELREAFVEHGVNEYELVVSTIDWKRVDVACNILLIDDDIVIDRAYDSAAWGGSDHSVKYELRRVQTEAISASEARAAQEEARAVLAARARTHVDKLMPAVYNAIQKKVKRGLYSAQVETLLPEGSVESREAAAYLVRILIDAGYAATIEPIRDSSFLEPTLGSQRPWP
jgi:hypothetical protein